VAELLHGLMKVTLSLHILIERLNSVCVEAKAFG